MKHIDATCPIPVQMTAPHQRRVCALLLMALCLAGCSSQTSSNQSAPSTTSPQTYVGLTSSGASLAYDTYAIDHKAGTFVEDAYGDGVGYEQYVSTSGAFTALPNGILNIGVTFANGALNAMASYGTTYNPPQTGNWAIEWPGQGGFAGLLGQTVTPFATNQACPSSATPQTFRFVTFPFAGDSAGTAYGSATIGGSTGSVSFNNIAQFNISGGPANNPSPASATGACGPTVFGQTISVPNTEVLSGLDDQTPSATIAIAPSGFLVEGNGYTTQTSPPTYENILGAGLGAVGLPQPSSALTTSSVVAAQYVAFIYSTGAATSNAIIVPPASLIGSFGYPNLQTACPALPAPQTATILYGGEFSNNNPAASAYGNCDFAIDLGTQDPKNNGLYPNATVYVGAAFPRTPSDPGFPNQSGGAYSFPAVAIAGQIDGKYAIFLIGLDTVALHKVVNGGVAQDWGIYLLQSN
jgi:hypothetical protein